jgi:hypothetical protein
MALGSASNPGVQSANVKLSQNVVFDKTTGTIGSNGAHLGATTLVAPTVLTVGASPYTYTNVYMGPTPPNTGVLNAVFGIQQIFITGGTVSAVTVTRLGTAITVVATPGTVSLGYNDSVTITYSAAPTMTALQMI